MTVRFGHAFVGLGIATIGRREGFGQAMAAMINELSREQVDQPDGQIRGVLSRSVPLIVRCLFEEKPFGWQAFSLEYGLAVQADTYEEARRRLESMIISYLRDALIGEDRPHAEVLLQRRATALVYFRYHWRRFFSKFYSRGDRNRNFKAFPLPLKAELALS